MYNFSDKMLFMSFLLAISTSATLAQGFSHFDSTYCLYRKLSQDYFRDGYVIHRYFGYELGNSKAETEFVWDSEKQEYWDAPDAGTNSGRWLAALTLEYNLTHDRKILEEIETIIDHFIKLDIASGELDGFVLRATLPNHTREPSMDQYLGVLFGYKMVWTYIDDFKIRQKVYNHTMLIGEYFQKHRFLIEWPNGKLIPLMSPGTVMFEWPLTRVFKYITGQDFSVSQEQIEKYVEDNYFNAFNATLISLLKQYVKTNKALLSCKTPDEVALFLLESIALVPALAPLAAAIFELPESIRGELLGVLLKKGTHISRQQRIP